MLNQLLILALCIAFNLHSFFFESGFKITIHNVIHHSTLKTHNYPNFILYPLNFVLACSAGLFL